ncbi:MAG: YggT family protein [Candidatus Margulisbacteria bacterium]|nr:YggT family protein [Candidatus Margulisiibacteriota bacterium]
MDFIIFVVNFLFSASYVLLAVRAVLPWIRHNKQDSLLRPIYLLTDPVLSVIRLGLPPARIGMDVSPYVVIVLLWIAQKVILKMLS